jgi:hypothetical protein
MLRFSFVFGPLQSKFSDTCNLRFYHSYADDGKIGGRILKVHKALDIMSKGSLSSNTICNQPRL